MSMRSVQGKSTFPAYMYIARTPAILDCYDSCSACKINF